MVYFPPIHFLHHASLIRQIDYGGFSFVFGTHVRISQVVVVGCLPRLAVAVEEARGRRFAHSRYLAGFRRAIFGAVRSVAVGIVCFFFHVVIGQELHVVVVFVDVVSGSEKIRRF